MKFFAILLALAVSSCAAFGPRPERVPYPRQMRLAEITNLIQSLSDQYMLPEFIKQSPSGTIVVEEVLLTSDLIYGVVKLVAVNDNGHIVDFYVGVACTGGCSALYILPIMDPMAEKRLGN
jgi:hypothetical protein